MPFCIDPKPTFQWPTPLTRPGEAEPTVALLTYRHKNRDELAAWVERTREAKTAQDEAALLADVLVEWDARDGSGSPVPLTVDNLLLVVDRIPTFGYDVTRAYTKAIGESRVKN